MAEETEYNSKIDLGLDLETQVLSQFFQEDFSPYDYIDAIFTSSLKLNKPSLNNKSAEFASSQSLKLLQTKCNALSNHFNEYTNELTRQFENKYKELLNCSNIISYSNDKNDEGINRLEYYLSNLNSSMKSLIIDLQNTDEKLEELKRNDGRNILLSDNDEQENESKSEVANEDTENKEVGCNLAVKDLQKLLAIKEKVQSVEDAFQLIKSLIASAEDENETSEINNLSLNEFKNALSVLQELMLEQIQNERQKFKTKKDTKVNEKLLKIIQNMIDLKPFFRKLVHFQPIYSNYANFLQNEKDRYLKIFEK